jgi:hypothetical protein
MWFRQLFAYLRNNVARGGGNPCGDGFRKPVFKSDFARIAV